MRKLLLSNCKTALKSKIVDHIISVVMLQKSLTLPPGPKTPFLLQTLQIITQPLQFLDNCHLTYGDRFTLRVLGLNSPPVVFFSHPQAIAAIFTTEAAKLALGQITHIFRPLVGSQSLIMQDGQRHQRLRQLIMPALHGDRLQIYGDLICQITENAINHWSKGEVLAIRHYTSTISLQIILRVVFGLNPGPRYDQLHNLIEPFLESVNSPFNSVQFFWPPLQQDLGPYSPWGQFLRQQAQIDNLIYAEIDDKRNHGLNKDILSLLMSAQDETGAGMTIEELRDQLITLLLLGHDTTASALSWVFYWLHQEPEILGKLKLELASLGSNIDPVKITQLPYLTAVCKEALRIYPIALISQPRVVKETVNINNEEFSPGTVLVPCIYLAHRRSEIYPEPLKFKPERFLDSKFSLYEYFPFGGGSRTCVGTALSMFEMKLVLATILLKYNLELANHSPVKAVRRGITFVPSDNFQLRVV